MFAQTFNKGEDMNIIMFSINIATLVLQVVTLIILIMIRKDGKQKMAGLTPDVAKEFKRTRDLIQSAKRDNSSYTDGSYAIGNENSGCVFDIAELADENSLSIEDLAMIIDDLLERVEALENA